ncbi:MAG: GDSL-type esterase/lipase family protein, partial [Ferruginibacter sp.]
MKYWMLMLLAITSFVSKSQNTFDSSFRFYYYDQKLSMFEMMPDQDKEVVWMGDSITDGAEWSELFPGLHTLNRGISSDNTFGLLYRIGEVTKRKPTKLFLLIGINDIARNIPNEVILRNYVKLIDSVQMQSPYTKIFIQTILPTNNVFTQFKNHQNKTEQIAEVNNLLKIMCQQRGLQLVDLFTAMSDADGMLDKRFTTT